MTGFLELIPGQSAPGSQNGFDNSGRRGSTDWQKVDVGAKQTIRVIKALADRYANKVASIELLNEPMGYALDWARSRNSIMMAGVPFATSTSRQPL